MTIYAYLPEFLKKIVFRFMVNRKAKELLPVIDRTKNIGDDDILLVCVLRNEKYRIPYFLEYYRKMGVNHFLFIDNGSEDGFLDYIVRFEDCSAWLAQGSYRKAKSGTYWMNALLHKHAAHRWCVVADPDEYLVFPGCETKSLGDLAEELDQIGKPHLFAFLLDMYPGGAVGEAEYREMMVPWELCPFFDSSGYEVRRHPSGHVWMRGGVRKRTLFKEGEEAPCLNKYPFVKWQKDIYFFASAHSFLPVAFGYAVDPLRNTPTGCLLHFKFFSTIFEKAREEMTRRQHAKNSFEYQKYTRLSPGDTLCDPISEKYVDSRQLVALGLMADGGEKGLFEEKSCG